MRMRGTGHPAVPSGCSEVYLSEISEEGSLKPAYPEYVNKKRQESLHGLLPCFDSLVFSQKRFEAIVTCYPESKVEKKVELRRGAWYNKE